MRQLIAGNWKMNGGLTEAAQIAAPLRRGVDRLGCDVVVCPPATVLNAVAHILVGSPVEVGGQDCHAEPAGAYTGDISAAMLRDAGARWVILGHSERRRLHRETDAQVRAKVVAALDAGLLPIVCVGETAAERQAGSALQVVQSQLRGSLPEGFAGTIAYEPLWAIGTGRLPEAADIEAMHGAIRSQAGPGVRILYGGSVKPDNAAAVLRLADVDGALVGGASLDATAFLAIAAASHAAAFQAGAAGLEPGSVAGKP